MPGSEWTNLFCHSPPHLNGMRHHFSPGHRVLATYLPRSGRAGSLTPALARDKHDGDGYQVVLHPY